MGLRTDGTEMSTDLLGIGFWGDGDVDVTATGRKHHWVLGLGWFIWGEIFGRFGGLGA